MSIDPIVAIIVVIVVIAAIVGISRMLAERANEQSEHQREEEERTAEKRKLEEERQRIKWMEQEERRKAEEAALATARERKLIADMEREEAQATFLKMHDELVDAIRSYARAGCDADFQQRFGVSRPPRGKSLEEDAEAQEYLRNHYASLRDAALADMTERFIQEEVDRQLAPAQEDPLEEAFEKAATASLSDAEANKPAAESGEAPDNTTEPEIEPPSTGNTEEASEASMPGGEPEEEPAREHDGNPGHEEPESSDSGEADEETPQESEAGAEKEAPPTDDVTEGGNDDPLSAKADGEMRALQADGADSEESESKSTRELVEQSVRENFDTDSLRTYLLAAIGSRFDQTGKPIGEPPWPAYTALSPLGYGELTLMKGAPTYAQDSYREFAWKKFHLGKRAEKPTRGEYSWPASHKLGDSDAGTSVETPAGTFTASTIDGPLPLREMDHCAWVRHDLEYQGMLLEPDGQRSLMVNLEGLRKGTFIRLRFDHKEEFLQEVEGTAYTLNAVGRVGDAYVGISVANPDAASPGEAPYQLASRDGNGFALQMTSDARRHDADTYPQFVQVNIAWCQPPRPHAERIVRHVTK